jgi:hypothetical protein
MPEWFEVPYEMPGPQTGEEYGILAVMKALERLTFPISKRDILEEVGDTTIEWTKGHRVSLRGIIEESPVEEFTSLSQVASAFNNVMAHREGEDKAA